MSGPGGRTILRQIAGPGGAERFCVLHEVPLSTPNAFTFACAGGVCAPGGVSMAEACELLMTAGVSKPDIDRLIDEARSGRRPSS